MKLSSRQKWPWLFNQETLRIFREILIADPKPKITNAFDKWWNENHPRNSERAFGDAGSLRWRNAANYGKRRARLLDRFFAM